MVSHLVRLLLTGFFVMLAPVADAQTQPAQAPATTATATLKSEELDQLVAPIALYPDTLLAEVLMAATYPLEVVQADRWSKDNKSLKGDQLKSAVDKQGWDDSVKSLTATPSVLDMMSGKLDWTQKLGDAVLAQQPDVMDAVQRLRTRAQAQNKLTTNKQQKVSVKTEQNKQVVVIEPAEPNTIYVPYYDPAVVYGAWPYPAYPPYYWPPPVGYYAGAAIATGIAFTAGIAVGAWAAGGRYWGGGVNWGGNNINVNRQVNINNTNINNWQHNPDHRHGVRYNNADVAQKFGKGGAARNNAQARMDFRGRDGQQVLKPGGERPGGDRPGAGGAGERRDIGNRPGGGERRDAGNRERPGAKGGGERDRPKARSGGGRDNAMGNINRGSTARAQADRGRASVASHQHASFAAARGGGGARPSMGGGGFRGGGGGMRGGGGRRSDIQLKHDIVRLGTLDNGLGFYRFAYNGSNKTYVGVIAQEVQTIRPDAVASGSDGYLRVRYDRIGVKFQTYHQWLDSGSPVPSAGTSETRRLP